MESENATPDKEGGGESAKSEAAADPKVETPAEAESTTDANNNSNESSEKLKGEHGEGEDCGSASKVDPAHAEGDKRNGMPKNLAENESQQSQTGGDKTGDVDASTDLPKTEMDSKSGENSTEVDSNNAVKQSPSSVTSPSTEEATTASKSEKIDSKKEEKTENEVMEKETDTTQKPNASAISSNEKNGTNGEEEKGLAIETEKTSQDVSLKEPTTDTKLETDQALSTNEADAADKDDETDTGHQESENPTESTEEKKETAVGHRAESSADASLSIDKEKSASGDEEDAKLKVSVQQESENPTESTEEKKENAVGDRAESSAGASISIDKEKSATGEEEDAKPKVGVQQDGKNPTESTEAKKENVVSDRAESSADASISIDKEKSATGEKEDTKPKVGVESTADESNENGGISDKQEDTSMEIETDLVPSGNVEANPEALVKTPLTQVVSNSGMNLEEQDDTYDDFQKKRSPKKKRKKSQKQSSIKIKIAGMSTEITKIKMVDASSSAVVIPDKPDFALSCQDSLIPRDYDVVEKELEDSLGFFELPHEDQDPTYTEFINKEKRDRITLALNNLQVEEESGKKEIAAIVNQQLKNKQGSTERYIEKHRLKIATEQKSDLTRLQQAYATKSRSNKGKIEHGVQVLRKKHADENQKYLQQHRQQVQQRRVPEQIANAEWAQIAQRLNAKHNRQMHDFSRKGKEVMNKYKVEFERERTRITKVYEKRLQDLNTQRQNLYSRIYSTLQQIRQRHLKKHLLSIAERREVLKQELASAEDQPVNRTLEQNKKPSPDKPKTGTDEKLYLRPVSPIKTATDWRKESVHEASGAATRHKHRKGVLSQINRQLSVEIHNEGIWLSELSEKKNNQNKAKDSSDNAATTESDKKFFFPWGVKARKILESIVCGEIPFTCDDSTKFNFSETVAQNGGHIRCVMTDLRTSDATASAQRAEAIMKKEVDDVKKLEEKDAAIKKNMAEMGKNIEIIRKQQRDLGLKLKETLKDYEKTKQHLQAFRTKYANFFGPDGKPLPTNDPNDTRKLTQHGLKYKMAIESSEKRGMAIKTKIAELQASLQKREANNKTGERAIASLKAAIKSKRHIINEVRSGRLNLLQSKSIENPANRVKDTINILGLAADMRRDQLNQKRNSNTSSHWVQSLPGVPAPLRRSLWYKMHRRRQQIVLRPTFSSMLTTMRKEIESKLNSIDTGIRRGSKEATEDKLIKAEQSYLLVTHPVEEMNEKLHSLPSSSTWAEPGWYLKLGVEKDDSAEDRILPCHPRQPLVQHNLSELYSAPGRQAASMINSTHLRSLETPLSAVATATSLSETDPAMAKSADPLLSSNDPLKMTRDALKLGYSFSVTKTPAAKPSTVTRRKSSSANTSSSASTKGTKKKTSASALSDSAVNKTSGTKATVNTTRTDNSRKRKTTSQSTSVSTPRTVQRQRTEPQRQQISVDDQAFQPRPIMTQPQQQQQPQQAATPFLQQAMPQQQQNPYNNQFINAMPSPVAPQQQAGHRGSFNQFQNAPQMNQFRMMQQQQSHHQQQHHHQQHSNQQKVNYGQMQQQPMRPNPQFFPQMGQQQFQQPMQMPGQGGMQMNLNNPVRQNMATSDEQNDPLFMLK